MEGDMIQGCYSAMRFLPANDDDAEVLSLIAFFLAEFDSKM
jgi:hypothetical protein